MQEVYIEFVDGEAVVYRPGTTEVAATTPTFEAALALARGKWPDLGIRVIRGGFS